MRLRPPILALLCLLASLFVPGILSASTPASASPSDRDGNVDGNDHGTGGFGSQRWTLDPLGNWLDVASAPDSGGTYALTQERQHNATNELLSLDVDGSGPTAPYALSYDPAGSLESRAISHVGDGTSLVTAHDAWGRLVSTRAQN